ncbi:MAG TPA: hypothetical protein VFT94_06710 [Gaiellaceae bacterium]|nr:hypothetical protein [Gaiellaceae bacterium]
MREATTDYANFIRALAERSIDPNRDEMAEVFESADFRSAGADARFYGETHSPETSVHVFSSFIELGSDDAATSALDWLEMDQMKPCPMSCAVQRSRFEVDDIPDARGVHRVATADDIERLGTKDEQPQDDYWIGFTNGPIVYTMVLHGHAVPGTVSEDQAREIAIAYYERLTGS